VAFEIFVLDFSFKFNYFFIKLASGGIHQVLGAVILQLTAFLLGGLILLFFKFTGHNIQITNKGGAFAVIAGLAIGLAEILSFYAYSKGALASTSVPIIVSGSMIVAAVAGLIVLKENFNAIHYFAVILIVVGTIILTYR